MLTTRTDTKTYFRWKILLRQHIVKSLSSMKIGTHSGHFHADEALAVWMLKQIPKFANADVVRSRDPAVLEQCDIVVDVGGKYDPPKWYDHHQREFETTFDSEHIATKLSSAGLVYKHYGREVVTEVLTNALKSLNSSETKKPKLDVSDIVNAIYVNLYDSFIEAVDGLDNGVTAYTEQPKYKLRGMYLQSVVANLSPNPLEDGSDEVLDRQFQKASDLMGLAFEGEIRSAGLGWYPARETVVKAFNERHKYDQDGRIVVLDTATFWKEHLSNLENNDSKDQKVLYVLYPTSDSYRVQAVSVEEGSFESRKALPSPWRGLRDEELSEKTGIPGGVFVHASGFICGNKTREGAIEMAQKAVDF